MKGLAGHAGAMLQARRLGKELVVGVHSDAAILENKGPTVMTLEERLVQRCKELAPILVLSLITVGWPLLMPAVGFPSPFPMLHM
jgi:bifunctional ADP-heptose synthase (sugar kinase/adenylyltransferase)